MFLEANNTRCSLNIKQLPQAHHQIYTKWLKKYVRDYERHLCIK